MKRGEVAGDREKTKAVVEPGGLTAIGRDATSGPSVRAISAWATRANAAPRANAMSQASGSGTRGGVTRRPQAGEVRAAAPPSVAESPPPP